MYNVPLFSSSFGQSDGFDTLISFTSMEMSVSNPRKTCKEASKSSVIPILALTSPKRLARGNQIKNIEKNKKSVEKR